MSLLEVSGLEVTFPGGFRAVDGVSFEVRAGRVLAVVGESGSGKSVTSLAVMRLLRGARIGGAIRFDGIDVPGADERVVRSLRGDRMAMVFQDSLSSLNPYYPVAFQIAEAYRAHRGTTRRAAREVAIGMLERVGIPEPGRRARDYPHQFSGGMRQRVMIAMALCLEPDLLIADEPTTALDVTVQAQILDLVDGLRRDSGTAVMLITHDMGVVAGMADDVAVLRAGALVERGSAAEVFLRPRAEYTRALLACVPRLDGPVPRRLPTVPALEAP